MSKGNGSKPATREVTRFACGNCKTLFETAADADKHCVCKCGNTVEPERRFGYGVTSECARCITKNGLITAHASVRRAKKSLAEAESNLASWKADYAKIKDAVPVGDDADLADAESAS